MKKGRKRGKDVLKKMRKCLGNIILSKMKWQAMSFA